MACSECRIRNGGGQKFASQPKPSNVMIVSLHRLNNEQKAICFTCFSSAEICSASALFLAILLHQPVHKCSLPQPALQFRGQVDPLWKSIISVWFFQKSLYGGPCHRNHCWILIQLKSDLNWLTTFRLQEFIPVNWIVILKHPKNWQIWHFWQSRMRTRVIRVAK